MMNRRNISQAAKGPLLFAIKGQAASGLALEDDITVIFARISLILLTLFSLQSQAQTIKESDRFAIIGEPKYAAGFDHYDYANPAAPKGGAITLAAIGTFDNFNRYAMRGNPGIRTESLYDTLFTTSDDEPGSYYPLIAEHTRYADDFSWMEIALNPRARYHDGSPVTASDVAFTFQKFMTEGVPQFRLYYKGTTVKAIAPLTVRIDLAKPGKENMLSLMTLPVMPEKFWKNHKLSDPLSAPPLASGPYRITAWRMGQYITYSRVKDYWAADLPVNRGRWNFDTLRYDYYPTTTSLSKPLRPAPSTVAKRTLPRTGLPATSGAILPTAISLKMNTPTPRRRIRSGWPLTFSARYFPTAGYAKPLPSPLILNG